MAGVTLKRVAARAGVSHQTVANVINGVSVRPETYDRVQAAMRELDYQPNFAARALRAARAMTLTLAFFEHHTEEITDPYRSLVQAAVTHEATQLGYSLLNNFIYRSGSATITTLQQQFQQQRTDGAILVGLLDDPELVRQLRHTNVPIVLYDYSGAPTGFPTVAAQYGEGMRQLVDHVVSQGRRHLALISAPDEVTTRIERERSFLAAAQHHGVHTSLCRGDWSFAAGEQAFEQLWQLDHRPDAILAANDRMAVGCLAAAREQGVRIPDDLIITGFDDFEFSRYTAPALTTVHVPYAQMAHEALRLLIQVLSGSPQHGLTQHYPVTFVRRQSA